MSNNDYQFHYEHNHALQQGHGSHWIFPHINTFTMDHSEPFRIIGIKFKVGFLYSFKTSLLASYNESLLSNSLKNPQEVCNRLDEILKPLLCKGIKDKHSELVRNILPLFDHTPIAQLGTTLNFSQRTVERIVVNSDLRSSAHPWRLF